MGEMMKQCYPESQAETVRWSFIVYKAASLIQVTQSSRQPSGVGRQALALEQEMLMTSK